MARINAVIDSFSGVPGTSVTAGGLWTHIRQTTWQGRPPAYFNNGVTGQDGGVHYQAIRRAGSFSPDQYAQIAIKGFRFYGPDARAGVMVRCGPGIDAQSTYYAAWVYDNNENGAVKGVALVKVVNGVETALDFYSSGVTWTNDDVIGLEVTGAGPVKLKVFKGATQIGTTVSDSTNPILSGNPGVVITGTIWADDWEGGELSGNIAPVFAGQLANITVVSGTAKTQPVTGFSDPGDTLTYRVIGAPAGVTIGASSGTITVAANVAVGTYPGIVVRATDSGGLSADSNAFSITVSAATPLSVTTQPTPQSVAPGSTATFSVTAVNAAAYQWYRSTDAGVSWSAIGGATGSSYTTPATSVSGGSANNGDRYKCVLTGVSGGTLETNAVSLTVTNVAVAPSITTQPASATVAVGAKPTLSVVASGTAPLTYQWQSRASASGAWANIAGASASTYTLPAVTAADNGKQFRCVVTNSAGSATSSTATLTVAAASIITTPVLKNNAGTVLANETGATVHIYQTAGPLVVTKTGQSTNASGVMSVSDAALTAGTTYRVVFVLASGAEGMAKLQAA